MNAMLVNIMVCNYECNNDKHMPTGDKTDNDCWGGKTVYYSELGKDKNAKDKNMSITVN
jgi:hypothetical protein